MPERSGGIDVLECRTCGALDPGPRSLCRQCQSADLIVKKVDGRGRLVSFTTIRRPPTAFREDGEYVVAVVALDAGVQVTGRLDAEAGQNSVKPGHEVELIGHLRQTPVFAPLEPATAPVHN